MRFRDKRERGGLSELTSLTDWFLHEGREADRKTYTDKPRGLVR